MSSTELLDTLRRANQDLHTSHEITAPPSMLKYIDVIVYRFHVPSHHSEYNGDTVSYISYTWELALLRWTREEILWFHRYEGIVEDTTSTLLILL